MSRVLLLTTEPLPLPGMPTTGAGLRAWGLAMGLRAAGHAVRLLMPSNAAATFGGEGEEGEKVRLRQRQREGEDGDAAEGELLDRVGIFERGRLADAVRGEEADAIVLQHWGLARELGEVDAPLAIDLAGPHLLERRLWGSADPEGDLREKLDALRRADFLTCSGVYQRHYFLPYLAMAGWNVETPEAMPVIPFSFKPAETPLRRPAKTRHNRLVYGGFLLPWQDPTVVLEAALEAMDAAASGELVFVGGPHPTLDVSRGRFETLLNRLEGHPRVRRMAPMSFDRYLALLAEGGVALDVMARNAERELAYTTRTVVYLAAGLPVVHDDYSELGALIGRAGAGWTVPAEDREGIETLLERILKGEEPVERRAAAARALAERDLDWDRTVAPLAAWCADPKPRGDKLAKRLAFEEQGRRLERLDVELRETRGELETLKGKRWVRWGLDLFSARGWLRWPLAALALALGVLLIPVFLINDLFAPRGGGTGE
jgi:hypothetical protein